MKKSILHLAFLAPLFLFSQTNYEQAWKALDQNKWADAFNLLLKAKQDPATFSDAYITNIYVETYKGREKEITDVAKAFYPVVENPYPYLYALWFNESVVGENGKKQFGHQVDMIKQLVKDQNAPVRDLKTASGSGCSKGP